MLHNYHNSIRSSRFPCALHPLSTLRMHSPCVLHASHALDALFPLFFLLAPSAPPRPRIPRSLSRHSSPAPPLFRCSSPRTRLPEVHPLSRYFPRPRSCASPRLHTHVSPRPVSLSVASSSVGGGAVSLRPKMRLIFRGDAQQRVPSRDAEEKGRWKRGASERAGADGPSRRAHRETRLQRLGIGAKVELQGTRRARSSRPARNRRRVARGARGSSPRRVGATEA